MQAFHDEAIVWTQLRHPNITPFLGVSSIMDLALVSEWMFNGTLDAFLRDNPFERRSKYVRNAPALRNRGSDTRGRLETS